MYRLIGLVPPHLADREDLSFEDVRPHVKATTGVEVQKVNWFSKYRVHHRVADRFQKGRAFIAGDAGHIHSPVGGQGMNTGIGDAINLSWKLAAVLQGRAEASILATYESERIAFARTLVATTDTLFTGIVSKGITAQIVRNVVIPHLVPFALGFSAVRRAQFRLVSQTRINYRDSALSEGSAGSVHGGDRLPWVEGSGNFAPLKSVDWQIHVYGKVEKQLKDAAARLQIPLHEFAWSEPAHHAGLLPDAMYVVRPDGYVALADKKQDAGSLERFVSKFNLAPRDENGT